MQQRVARSVFLIARMAFSVLSFQTLAPGAQANQTPSAPEKTAPNARADAEDKSDQTELPLLLLVWQRPAAATVRGNEIASDLLNTLRAAVRASGQFRVLSYSPNHQSIKRLLTEHVLASADLIEPIKPDVLERLARALGAQYILTFEANSDKTGLQTTTRFKQAMGPQDWVTRFAEQSTIDATAGKRRLKPAEMVGLAVDAITDRMGIPTHLSGKQRAPGPAAPGPAPVENGTSQGKPEPLSLPNTTAPPSGKTGTNVSGGPRSNSGGPHTNTGAKPNSAFTTDAAPGRATMPVTPPVAPPPNGAHTDPEILITQYRQAGDLANTILALRHAINDQPRDMPLRHQLIRAYQERKLFDDAAAETSRALLLAPTDSILHRMYGDTLLAKSQGADALKAYREAVRLDPNDLLAQVALGDALLADNQYTDALQAYEAAAKTDTKSPLPHRRLARALVVRAGSDLTQYTASLTQVRLARELTPTTETRAYTDDYIALMRLMEARLRDLLAELQNTSQAYSTGSRTSPELARSVADLKQRAEAAADYLDNLPPAAGQDVTHAYYQHGATLLLQGIALFREALNKGGAFTGEALRGSTVEARRELAAGGKRLDGIRSETDPEKSPGD